MLIFCAEENWEAGHVIDRVVAFAVWCAAGKWSSVWVFCLWRGILGIATKAGYMQTIFQLLFQNILRHCQPENQVKVM